MPTFAVLGHRTEATLAAKADTGVPDCKSQPVQPKPYAGNAPLFLAVQVAM